MGKRALGLDEEVVVGGLDDEDVEGGLDGLSFMGEPVLRTLPSITIFKLVFLKGGVWFIYNNLPDGGRLDVDVVAAGLSDCA